MWGKCDVGEKVKTKQEWKIGDCLNYMREYSDKYFDLILTDPPYGIGESNEKNLSRIGGLAKATNFSISYCDDNRISKEYFDEMLRISKNQIIFGGNYYTDYLFPTSCWIVWYKDNGNTDFADCELAWTSFKSATRYFKHRWNGMLQEDMKHKEKRIYPTQKPCKLFERILLKYSKENDLICDPFLGSGTTLRACMNTNRNCIGFELNSECEKLYRERLLLDNVRFI